MSGNMLTVQYVPMWVKHINDLLQNWKNGKTAPT